jgi:hypothetical protein
MPRETPSLLLFTGPNIISSKRNVPIFRSLLRPQN